MAARGDIVTFAAEPTQQWVVCEQLPHSQPDIATLWSLICWDRPDGVPQPGKRTLDKFDASLTVVSSNAFTIGERVEMPNVDRQGTVQSTSPEGDVWVLEDADEVSIDNRKTEFRNERVETYTSGIEQGIKVTRESYPVLVPIWELVLANRL